ncbi:MAG: hypothetical protein KIT80_06375 [Chitinophagaceae bacterium]|nr:hypothetical protein [Chitinophagaceae bacterium]MCW5926521.1 hypothetical protein [Chitinophagaceae bacterium]
MNTSKLKISVLFISFSFFAAVTIAQQDIAYVKVNGSALQTGSSPTKYTEPDTNISTFKYLKLSNTSKYGFLEKELMQLFPELVKEKTVSYMYGKNAYRKATVKVLDEEKLVYKMATTIKAQELEIEKLKALIAELQKGAE